MNSFLDPFKERNDNNRNFSKKDRILKIFKDLYDDVINNQPLYKT